jgi:5-methyltetrahydrofolate--homocysteine methyltransferase
MIIIGEKINASRRTVADALDSRDKEFIAHMARCQAEAGADYLDLNAGNPDREVEAENIAWLTEVVQDAVDLPVSIDTTCAEAAEAGLARARKRPILNSISLESQRLREFTPVIQEFDCDVVALTMSDDGPPDEVHERLNAAGELIELLLGTDRDLDQIHVDPCFFPVASKPGSGPGLMESIAAIREEWPEVHIIGGVSNISYGLPGRNHLNLAAIAQGISHGLDAAIIDPTAPAMTCVIHASEVLAGRDEFCMNYVATQREDAMR